MRSPCLQSLSVLHQSFNAISFNSTGEPFIWRFYPFHHWDAHPFFSKFGINTQYHFRFLDSFSTGSMGSVPFLPEEFGSTEEKPCPHFPPKYICPLVYEQWKVTVRFNPVAVRIPNNGFRSWPDNQFFFQFGIFVNFNSTFSVIFKPIVRNNGTFFGKTFNVRSFFIKK